MSDEQAEPGLGPSKEAALDEITGEVLPALIARLRSSQLGELEVRTDSWRVRLRRSAAGPSRPRTGPAAPIDEGAGVEVAADVARAPAVGYFSPAPGLVVGRSVQAGDTLGSVDVLGIAHDVAAPTDGIVGRVLAEAGQAVEYGQPLVDIDPWQLIEPLPPET